MGMSGTTCHSASCLYVYFPSTTSPAFPPFFLAMWEVPSSVVFFQLIFPYSSFFSVSKFFCRSVSTGFAFMHKFKLFSKWKDLVLLMAEVPELSISFLHVLRYLLHNKNLHWLYRRCCYAFFTGVFTEGACCLLASEQGWSRLQQAALSGHST